MAKRPAYSNLMKEIRAGKFVFSGELEPTKMYDIRSVLHSAEEMKKTGKIVAANVTDGPQGDAYTCSMVPSYLVQEKVGLEAVWQMTVRDRNRIALFGDVVGGAILGLKNILTLTGDHTALGDNKNARPVYDLDSTQFIELVSKIVDEGTDLEGKEIEGGKIEMNIGCAANPNARPPYLEPEILKVGRKVEVGVDFIQTQTAFDIDEAKEFLKELERYDVPVLLGLFPLKNYGIAWYFDKYIPGVSVPKDLLGKLKSAKKVENKKERNAKIDQINIDFFLPFINEIRKTTKAAGIHCMAVHYERLFGPLLKDF
ncbi:MAG: methylenetetrahydrofolate reductase [Candidatus Thorarchaeota archaeon]